MSKKDTSPINTPGTYEYRIARACTTAEWRAINNDLHNALDSRSMTLAVEWKANRLTDEQFNADPELSRLNTLCTLTHEIMRLRTAIHAVAGAAKE